jgi:hypothetical protein
MKSPSVGPVEPWPRTVSVMFGLAIVVLVAILLLALAQSSHRTRAQAKPVLVVPAPAEAPPTLVVPAPAEAPPTLVVPAPAEAPPTLVVPAQAPPALVVPAPAEAPPADPLFDVGRIERLLKRGENRRSERWAAAGRRRMMSIPGRSGDLKVIWDRHSRVEVEAARQ